MLAKKARLYDIKACGEISFGTVRRRLKLCMSIIETRHRDRVILNPCSEAIDIKRTNLVFTFTVLPLSLYGPQT